MDFIDELKQFSSKVRNLKGKINTEEATKTSIIMPFFQILGYDVFNPEEFLPEYTADVGIKKGEKVDYAIMQNNEPLILIEAKQHDENELKKHTSQLFRYFGTTKAKFAILTNGINYIFYTDLKEQNKMDLKPFLEFDLFDLKDSTISELKKFKKENFDVDTIYNSASELKYTNEIKQLMASQFQEPSDEFIKYILGEIYSGVKTNNVIKKFKDIVKKSLNQFINELMNDTFKSMVEKQVEQQNEKEQNKVEPDSVEKPEIITTLEELEAFFTIKSILREFIETEKITYKDTYSYFGILLENNTWKWICRVYLKDNRKYITIPNGNKQEVRHDIKKIEDIYNYRNEIIEALKRYKK